MKTKSTKKTKNCKNCNACIALYRKLFCGFSKLNVIMCSERNQFQNLKDTCELWRPKINSFDFSKQRFDRVLSDIDYLLKEYRDL